MSQLTEMQKAHNISEEEAARYREGFENIFRIVILQGLLILGLTGTLCYYVLNVHPQDRFFASTITGAKIQLQDLSDPTASIPGLLSWATMAASDVLTFGFNDIDERFSTSRTYFTDDGWDAFVKAMSKSGLFKNAIDNKQIITSIPSAPPELVQAGIMGAEYGWVVKIPMLMTMRAGPETRTSRMSVTMIIIKVPTRANPRGLGIYQWVSM